MCTIRVFFGIFFPYNDFDVGIHGFQCHCTSRNESTAPYWYDHCIYIWYLLNNFKTHSSLASNNVWMVIPGNIFENHLDIQMSPSTGPKIFWAGPNFLCQTKNLFTYCGSQSQTFCAIEKDDLHSVKLFFVLAQKFLKRH